MKVLIVKLGALGDVINTLPLAVNIKTCMNAEIHWLVAPLSYPLVKEHNCVDRAILFDKKKPGRSFIKAVKEIRKTKYDIALDVQRLLKSGLFTMLARSERKLGFDKKRCREMSHLFNFERITPAGHLTHMLTQYMEFAEHLGIESEKIAWNIPWTKQTHKLKHEFRIASDYIVLNTGATKSANRWQGRNFARLAEMIDKTLKFTPVLTGGPEDMHTADTIEAEARCKIQNLCGKTTLQELSLIIDNAECVISCDTGPMHLASALGTKLIALFGPSDPFRTGPFRGSIIREKIECSPCNKKRCASPLCMEKIQPEYVFKKLVEKVGKE